jgi:hypothetical protein
MVQTSLRSYHFKGEEGAVEARNAQPRNFIL